jgi:hypothetical protein
VLQEPKSVTVEQVGPAHGQPRTIVALEAAVDDWLPCARIPSWPGAPSVSNEEAADTSAVRPVHTLAAALACSYGNDQRPYEGVPIDSLSC